MGKEEIDERGHILFALAQCRKINRDDGEAVIQVLAEPAFADFPFEEFMDVVMSNYPKITGLPSKA